MVGMQKVGACDTGHQIAAPHKPTEHSRKSHTASDLPKGIGAKIDPIAMRKCALNALPGAVKTGIVTSNPARDVTLAPNGIVGITANIKYDC